MSVLTKALGAKPQQGGRSPTMKLAAYLKDGYVQEERSPGFHASALYRLCPRELALTALAAETDDAVDERVIGVGLQWRFDVGHALHQWIQDRYFGPMGMLEGIWRCSSCFTERYGLMPKKPHCIPKAGHSPARWTFREVPVADPKLGIVGKSDGIYIPSKGKRLVLDIKTVSPDYYMVIRGPSIDYIWQAVCYMHLLKLDEAIILYVAPTMTEGQDRLPFKEFFVDYDRRIWAQIVAKVTAAAAVLAELKKGRRKIALPGRLEACAVRSSRRANDCPARDLCFSDAAIKKFQV